jgi:hypothetical protein
MEMGAATRLTALLLATLAVACAPASPRGAVLTDTFTADSLFTLAVGQEAAVAGPRSLRVVAVTADSRCPGDVQCVWAGDAVVRVSLARPGSPSSIVELHTGVEPRSATVDGYTVTLRSLRPDPRSGRAIPAAEYRAELLIGFPP